MGKIVFESPAWLRQGQIADSWVQITLHSSKANCDLLGKREKLNLPYVDRMTVFPGGTSGKEPSCQCRRHEMWVQSLVWEDPLEESMATHYSILTWRIPWTEFPGGLYSPWGCKESDMTEVT